MLNKILLSVVLIGFIVSCESGGNGKTVDAPIATLNCTEALCGVGGFRDAVVVLTLSGCAPDQISFEDVASAAVQMSCNGSSCTGSLASNEWSPDSLPSRNYYVCGWIDIDNNGVKNSNDVFSEDREIVDTDTTLTITSWDVTYSFFINRNKKH